ncbi:MAG: NADH-quinone oxidoreductase subunit C [Gammaproteobacteria bacterium]|nr:NADH-quinone oxidoreductase subunit C [Gammaproteobacteria bacterium]
MSTSCDILAKALRERFTEMLLTCEVRRGEVTVEVAPQRLREVCLTLRDDAEFGFEQLIDLCGVDYLLYGKDEWATEESTSTGFSRGVDEASSGRLKFGDSLPVDTPQRRFAAVSHLLSLQHNWRLRVRCFAESGDVPVIPSLTEIWNSAEWYEREAFDLYGILFEGHTDLRRLLTDYGFVGHPFRKDFPLVGHVEMRYDPDRQRVVYEPVSIEPRVLVPRVIRDDNRFLEPGAETSDDD